MQDKREKIAAILMLIVICALLGGYAVEKYRISKINAEYKRLNNLSAQYLKNADFVKAKISAQEAIKLIPTEIGGYINLSGACIGLGDYECAYQSSLQAVKISPERMVVRNLSILAAKLNKEDEDIYWSQVSKNLSRGQ